MLRLRRICQRLYSTQNPQAEASTMGANTPFKKLWVFPVRVPLFLPKRGMLNKYITDLLVQHKFKYAVAMTLRENKKAVRLNPQSLQELEKIAGLQSQIKPQQNKDDLKKPPFFSGLKRQEQVSVVGKIDDVYPVANLCEISFDYKHEITIKPTSMIYVDLFEYEHLQNICHIKNKDIKRLALQRKVDTKEQLAQIKKYVRKIQTIEPKLWPTSDNINLENICDILFNHSRFFSAKDVYRYFKEVNEERKLQMLIQYLKKYAETMEQKKKQARQKLPKFDVLKETYEKIKKDIGQDEDGLTKYIQEVKKQLKVRPRPPQISAIVQSQLNSLGEIGKLSGQFAKKKSYITYLMQYPFGVLSKDSTDLEASAKILDEDHYSMKKVKQRILEFIAVGKLKGSFKSKAIILHGPPGVGKTSIAKSIASCLGRPYERIALGGQVDPDLLRGHRRTYVASYPGKIFAAINKCKAENPVILLDQIDKIDIRRNGSSLQDVILEVLDPMQNINFKDNFLDVQIDLSNVLFICTANVLDTISPPLLDRLEQIQVTGYTLHQKKEIFKRYLIKKAMKNSGLEAISACQINFSEEALEYLIENYCREAGVRSLSQQTQKLCQKIARKHVEGQHIQLQLTPKEIRQYLGEPKFFRRNLLTDDLQSGTAIGLAYTGLGGCTLPIESSKSNLNSQNLPDGKKKKGSLLVTGNIQDVMKQSCDIAYTYAKHILSSIDNEYLQVNDVHINFPELQIGKDGPSAGIAITTTFLSLAMDKPIIKKIGMTGEINLSGDVMKIGGVKQKVLGARRDGVFTLIFPSDNKKDVEQLEEEVKQGVNFVFVEKYEDVFRQVFGIQLKNNNSNNHENNDTK